MKKGFASIIALSVTLTWTGAALADLDRAQQMSQSGHEKASQMHRGMQEREQAFYDRAGQASERMKGRMQGAHQKAGTLRNHMRGSFGSR